MKDIFIDIFKSEMLWTVVSGVIVFILSQLLFERWIRPMQKFMDLKSRISTLLVLNAPYYSNALQLANESNDLKKTDYENVSTKTREMAAELRGFIEIMPMIHIGIPSKRELYLGSKEMIGLSNGLYKPYNINDRSTEEGNINNIKEIKKNLHIFNYEKVD